MDTEQPKSSDFTGDFEAAHSALIIDANFASTKIAIGRIFILENDRIEPSEDEKIKRFGLSPEEISALPEDALESIKEVYKAEQTERFNDARDRTIVTYENYLSDADNAMIEVRDIAVGSLGAEVGMVKDPHIQEEAVKRIQEGASAEVALDEVYEDRLERFRKMDDPYFKKMVVEIEQQRATMQHHLHPDKTLATLDNIQEGTLLVSPTFPLHALSSFRDRDTGQTLVNGTITDAGSLESHGAILITGMGIPYARISKVEMARMKNGDMAIMDGESGKILLHPNKTVIEEYEQRIEAQNNQSEALLNKSSKKKTVITTDGVKINVHANFALSDEAYDLKEANPVGIGLYRTEIAASMRDNSVNAKTWANIFKHNMAAADAKGKDYISTTIRTIDLAGDKSDLPKAERETLEAKMTKEQMRGIVLLQQELVEEGYKSKLKVMVPTIASNEEMISFQKMMDDQAEDLGVKSIKLGCMVEVPSLLTELDKLDVAFMSVGSNDLIHSILGIDRYDSESILKKDPTNQAVLKALSEVTRVGQEREIPVSICGDMASDPKYTALLIGAGFTNVSAKVDSIPVVKEIASRVNTDEAEQLFDVLLDTETRAGREAILADYNARLGLTPDGKIDMNWQPPENDWALAVT